MMKWKSNFKMVGCIVLTGMLTLCLCQVKCPVIRKYDFGFPRNYVAENHPIKVRDCSNSSTCQLQCQEGYIFSNGFRNRTFICNTELEEWNPSPRSVGLCKSNVTKIGKCEYWASKQWVNSNVSAAERCIIALGDTAALAMPKIQARRDRLTSELTGSYFVGGSMGKGGSLSWNDGTQVPDMNQTLKYNLPLGSCLFMSATGKLSAGQCNKPSQFMCERPQVDHDPCLRNVRCLSNGTCIPVGCRFRCQCPDMTFGTRCEYDDHNVASVQIRPTDEITPYYNASIITSYHPSNKLIAAQSPTDENCEMFWRMVIDNEVNVIVGLCEDNETGNHRYWPKNCEKLDFGMISVRTLEEKVYAGRVERICEVTTEEFAVRVLQIVYGMWPENTTPVGSEIIFEMIKRIDTHHQTLIKQKHRTILVHCSDGAGRTGTFCAIFNLIERLVAEHQIDIFRTVKDLRDQRPRMVQTMSQYEFCYHAVYKFLQLFAEYGNFKCAAEHNVYEFVN